MIRLGLDIGTTSISAAAVDQESGRTLWTGSFGNDSFLSTPNIWERIQDTECIRETAMSAAAELRRRYPEAVSIGLTGQMHGIVYLDAEGNALSPLYTWQDGRGGVSTDGNRSIVQEISEVCGISASTGYGLVTHIYNLRNHLVPEGAVVFCTIADYIGMQLTGRKEPLIHSSNAASLGFYDVPSGRFLMDELEKMGVSPGQAMLPPVTQEPEILGMCGGIPVTAAIGDNQASFLGAIGIEDGAVLVNMGTGGQISVLSDRCITIPGIEARPLIPGKYLLAGSSLCGGRSYMILEKFFRSYAEALNGQADSQYQIMDRLAARGEQLQDHIHADTYFNGSRTDPDRRAVFSNICEDNFTPESLVYGVLEGMAAELYEMYLRIHDETGVSVKKLVASGNGLRKNEVLKRIFSRMFRTQLRMADNEEEAACGAALAILSVQDSPAGRQIAG